MVSEACQPPRPQNRQRLPAASGLDADNALQQAMPMSAALSVNAGSIATTRAHRPEFTGKCIPSPWYWSTWASLAYSIGMALPKQLQRTSAVCESRIVCLALVWF